MYAFRCAYRFSNGSIAGFVGFGFGEYSARKDCHEQVRRRLLAMPGEPATVDDNRLIFSERDLTPDEMEGVRRDWARGLRYAADGAPYPD